jgi:hypothetical protein
MGLVVAVVVLGAHIDEAHGERGGGLRPGAQPPALAAAPRAPTCLIQSRRFHCISSDITLLQSKRSDGGTCQPTDAWCAFWGSSWYTSNRWASPNPAAVRAEHGVQGANALSRCLAPAGGAHGRAAPRACPVRPKAKGPREGGKSLNRCRSESI